MQHYFCAPPSLTIAASNSCKHGGFLEKHLGKLIAANVCGLLSVCSGAAFHPRSVDAKKTPWSGSIFFWEAVLRLSLPSRPCTAAILNFNVNFFLKMCYPDIFLHLSCQMWMCP